MGMPNGAYDMAIVLMINSQPRQRCIVRTEGYFRRNTPQNDLKGLLWILFRPC